MPVSRRYTLTHNDLTGALNLSIGSDYNVKQIQGFYTRILRDEITAEWYFSPGASAPAELHIYCHVSGEEKWLAPPQLRNFIFRREMTLVGRQNIFTRMFVSIQHTHTHRNMLSCNLQSCCLMQPAGHMGSIYTALQEYGSKLILLIRCLQVLDTFYYADKEFLRTYPELLKAKVYVHFQSDVQV